MQTAQDHINLGLAFTVSRNFGQAISEFERALSINPDDAEVHSHLANAYVFKGDYDKGSEEYAKALKLNPMNINADETWKLHANMGKFEKALKNIKAIEIKPRTLN